MSVMLIIISILLLIGIVMLLFTNLTSTSSTTSSNTPGLPDLPKKKKVYCYSPGICNTTTGTCLSSDKYCKECSSTGDCTDALNFCKTNCGSVPVKQNYKIVCENSRCIKEAGICVASGQNCFNCLKDDCTDALNFCKTNCGSAPVKQDYKIVCEHGTCIKEAGTCDSSGQNCFNCLKDDCTAAVSNCEKTCSSPTLGKKCVEKRCVNCKNNDKDCSPSCSNDSDCIPIPQLKGFNGIWSHDLRCGADTFDIISLTTANPSAFNTQDDILKNMFNDMEPFDPTYNYKNMYTILQNYKGTTIYLISYGGSSYTSFQYWNPFLDSFYDNGTIDVGKVKLFVDTCIFVNIKGIDFDFELDVSPDQEAILSNKLVEVSKGIKNYKKDFIIMFTILISRQVINKILLPSNVYDYVTFMLYNGGMYKANSATGGNCDWNDWAELLLSNGTSTACTKPLGGNRESFVKNSGIDKMDSGKVVLGVLLDRPDNTVNINDMNLVKTMINKYNSAGYMIWVVPGNTHVCKAQIQAVLPELKNFECPINVCGGSSSGGGSSICKNDKPCTSSCKNCIASSCAGSYNVKDTDCQHCTDPTKQWWPCSITGVCQCGDTA